MSTQVINQFLKAGFKNAKSLEHIQFLYHGNILLKTCWFKVPHKDYGIYIRIEQQSNLRDFMLWVHLFKNGIETSDITDLNIVMQILLDNGVSRISLNTFHYFYHTEELLLQRFR